MDSSLFLRLGTFDSSLFDEIDPLECAERGFEWDVTGCIKCVACNCKVELPFVWEQLYFSHSSKCKFRYPLSYQNEGVFSTEAFMERLESLESLERVPLVSPRSFEGLAQLSCVFWNYPEIDVPLALALFGWEKHEEFVRCSICRVVHTSEDGSKTQILETNSGLDLAQAHRRHCPWVRKAKVLFGEILNQTQKTLLEAEAEMSYHLQELPEIQNTLAQLKEAQSLLLSYKKN